MGGPCFVGSIHDIEKFFGRRCTSLKNALNLYIIALIFKNVQSIFIVKQIQTSPGIDLEETNHNLMPFEQVEQLNHQILLKLIHGISFARPRLSVGKTGNHAVVDKEGNEGFQRAFVDVFSVLNSRGCTSS